MHDNDPSVISEQSEYFRALAPEYDNWWQRLGRYDRSAESTARWHTEIAEIETVMAGIDLTGDVLELACGTGWWTQKIARTARSLTCIDASPETIALNRMRLAAAALNEPTYIVDDLFKWEPSAVYDVVFFSFWLSHVPKSAFAEFWSRVGRSLRPGGRAFFIDSARSLKATGRDHDTSEDDGMQERRLDNGSTFRIIKFFYEPAQLVESLDQMSWDATVKRTQRYFIYGEAILK